MTDPRPEVTVVVPVYGNAATLRELHGRLRQVMRASGHSYELLFVNDACPHGSLDVLNELARRDPRVATLTLSSNVGQQLAVLKGLERARGYAVVVMDADLQDPPEAIPALLARLREEPAAVFAARRGRHQGPARRLSSRLFKSLLHALTGVPADAGLFVAIDQRMRVHLLARSPARPFVLAMIGLSGLPIASVPVKRAPRPEGRSGYTAWRRLTLGVAAISDVLASRWRVPGRTRVEHGNGTRTVSG